MNTILLDAFAQKPAAAIDYLKRKGYAFSWDWYDLWKDAHARAFTVAKAAKLELLKDIRAMVEKAQAEGLTLQQFKKELTPQLQKHGWWGKKQIVNEETGEVSEYLAGSPRRLKTIYQTNLQTAYMAGRYKGQMDAAADLPYLQYIATLDGKTRDSHREMHRRIFMADDPIWNEFYPPNGWGCRCRVRSLTRKQLEHSGSALEDSSARIVEGEATVGKGDKAKQVKVRGLKMANGKTMWAAPGWDYNPGKSAWMPDLEEYDLGDARLFVQDGFAGPAYRRFIDARGQIDGEVPVAVLPDDYKKNIGAKTNVVWLSSETLTKNVREHPEILTADYLYSQTIIEQARVIVQDGANTMVFIKIGDKYYHAAIKATRTGETLFMTSLRLTDDRAIAQAKSKGRVIKDEL